MEQDTVSALVDWIKDYQKIVVLAGVELSIESGLPDFSDTRLNPNIREFRSDRQVRADYWKKLRDIYPILQNAEPNPAHIALAELEFISSLDCILTQSTDGLHHKAGNSQVIELNSSMLWVNCTKCGKDYSINEIIDIIEKGEDVPKCNDCGNDVLKPPISFPGQPPPHWEAREAWIRLHHSDLFLIVGASLEYEPAASYPFLAKERGAKVAIISESPGPADEYVDAVIYGKPSIVLPHIVSKIKEGTMVS